MNAINPTTGNIIASYEDHNTEYINNLLKRSSTALSTWRRDSFEARANVLKNVAEQLIKNRDVLATLMTDEMGKLYTSAQAEVDKCAWVCRHYAEQTATYLAPRQIASDATLSYVTYEPLGTILAVMPWNFPLWQVFRFAAPTLMAGNTAILKHAPNVPGCAQAITQLFRDAQAPEGLFEHVFINIEQTHDLLREPMVRGVSLTGSLQAGRAIASTAGQVCKPVLLELGGSDPFVVLDDANIERAVDSGLRSRFLNNGQSCIAAKRFIVVASMFNEFKDLITKRVSKMVVGDPMDSATDIGPIARADLRATLHKQVQQTIQQGGQCLFGGTIPDGNKGFFYPPTVLSNVQPGMVAFDEELFGPVATLTMADSTEHAISLANQTEYGLGASLWTQNIQQALSLIPQFHTGNVFVNGMVKSDPRLPFGGIKNSGLGRELAQEGAHAFVNAKTIWIA